MSSLIAAASKEPKSRPTPLNTSWTATIHHTSHALNSLIQQELPALLSNCFQFPSLLTRRALFRWLKTNPVTDSTCYPYDSYISGTPNTCRTACKDTTPFKNQYAIQGWEQLNTNENIKDSLLNDGSVLVVFKGKIKDDMRTPKS